MRLLVLRCIVVASLTGVVVSAQEDQPSLAEVLKAAGEYVATFERHASLATQEDYYQLVENNRRTLRSDMLFIPDQAFGWVEFRASSRVRRSTRRTDGFGWKRPKP